MFPQFVNLFYGMLFDIIILVQSVILILVYVLYVIFKVMTATCAVHNWSNEMLFSLSLLAERKEVLYTE